MQWLLIETGMLLIETGMYSKPKIPREQRLCPLCKDDIGYEFHCIMAAKVMI
jgi:hypothetical protein